MMWRILMAFISGDDGDDAQNMSVPNWCFRHGWPCQIGIGLVREFRGLHGDVRFFTAGPNSADVRDWNLSQGLAVAVVSHLGLPYALAFSMSAGARPCGESKGSLKIHPLKSIKQ